MNDVEKENENNTFVGVEILPKRALLAQLFARRLFLKLVIIE
jgi:hypothetical protein